MNKTPNPFPLKVKEDSERKVLAAGGEICDWLPCIEFTTIRSREDVVSRALILNALLQIAFKAPVSVIAGWITRHNLDCFLSASERIVLTKDNSQLTDQDKICLYWYIEALWAFLWATKIVPVMDFTRDIPDHMASFCPNLHKNEGPEKFESKMGLCEYEKLYAERDLYYRVMWHCRNLELTRCNHPNFCMDIVMERRKALDWIMDSSLDWDDVPQDT